MKTLKFAFEIYWPLQGDAHNHWPELKLTTNKYLDGQDAQLQKNALTVIFDQHSR